MALKTTSGLQAATSKTTKPWTRTSSSSNRLSNFFLIVWTTSVLPAACFFPLGFTAAMNGFIYFSLSPHYPPIFFFSSWMGVSVRMVLTTASASTTLCLFVLTHSLLFCFYFLFVFVCPCLPGSDMIFNEVGAGFGLVSSFPLTCLL